MVRIDEEHRYWVPDGTSPTGSRQVPGYSEICRDLGVVKDNPYWTDEGREAGSVLHQYLLFMAQGKNPAPADARIAGKVEGIRKFLSNSGFKLSFGEIPQYDPILRWACTPDLVGHMGLFSVNIDCKAGAPQRSHVLQLAAQKIALAAGGFRVQKSFGLYLKNDSYRLIEHDTRPHEARWKVFVNAYHAKRSYL